MATGPKSSVNAASRAEWARRSVAWKRTAKESESASAGYDQMLIEAAGISPGRTVLDIAAGMGDPTIAIAEHLGAAGLVVAADQSPDMLAGGQQRAEAKGLANIRFVAADMAQLPFPRAMFDAATCRYGLMFPPDRVAAAAEIRHVLRPGAKAAFQVWGPYEENTIFATVRKTVLAFFGESGGDEPPVRHVFAVAGLLAATLEEAGFADVVERPVTMSDVVPADESVWRNRLERSYADRIDPLDDAGRTALERALAEAFEPLREGDGYRVTTHAKLGIGTVT